MVLGGELLAEVGVGENRTDGTDGTDGDGGGFGFHCAKWVVEWGGGLAGVLRSDANEMFADCCA